MSKNCLGINIEIESLLPLVFINDSTPFLVLPGTCWIYKMYKVLECGLMTGQREKRPDVTLI